jgi:hypothetical protein
MRELIRRKFKKADGNPEIDQMLLSARLVAGRTWNAFMTVIGENAAVTIFMPDTVWMKPTK